MEIFAGAWDSFSSLVHAANFWALVIWHTRRARAFARARREDGICPCILSEFRVSCAGIWSARSMPWLFHSIPPSTLVQFFEWSWYRIASRSWTFSRRFGGIRLHLAQTLAPPSCIFRRKYHGSPEPLRSRSFTFCGLLINHAVQFCSWDLKGYLVRMATENTDFSLFPVDCWKIATCSVDLQKLLLIWLDNNHFLFFCTSKFSLYSYIKKTTFYCL